MVDPQLHAADRQEVEFRFGLAGEDPIADLETPFPDAGRELRDAEFDTLMNHLERFRGGMAVVDN